MRYPRGGEPAQPAQQADVELILFRSVEAVADLTQRSATVALEERERLGARRIVIVAEELRHLRRTAAPLGDLVELAPGEDLVVEPIESPRPMLAAYRPVLAQPRAVGEHHPACCQVPPGRRDLRVVCLRIERLSFAGSGGTELRIRHHHAPGRSR